MTLGIIHISLIIVNGALSLISIFFFMLSWLVNPGYYKKNEKKKISV